MKTVLRVRWVLLSFSFLFTLSFLPLRAQVFPIATNPLTPELAGGVVSGGPNYLVGMLSGADVVGQRLAGDGQLVGSGIPLGANPGFPPAVAMAGAKTNCLVVWSDNSVASGVSMFGQLCSTSTGLIGSSFPLLASVGSHGFQVVEAAASDGTNFLVVWRDTATDSLYGQFVNSQGSLSGAEFLLFTLSDGDAERNLAVTFGRTNYLVVWQDGGNNSNQAFGRLVSRNGSVGSTIQLSSTPSLDRNPLAVAFDGTNYLAVWNCSEDTSSAGWPVWTLRGRLVSQSGNVLGNELTLVEEQGSFPALAFDGDNYLLAWGYNTTTTNADITIHARFLDPLANPIGPILSPFPPQGDHPPLLPLNGVIFDGHQFMLVATYGSFVSDGMGGIVGFAGGDVYGAFLPRSTRPPVFSHAGVVNGQFGGRLQVVPGQSYTIEISANLSDWMPAALVSSDAADHLDLVDEEGVAGTSRLFYRALIGNTAGASHTLRFALFAEAGGFGSGFTPSPTYPVSVSSYSAALDVENDPNLPPSSEVAFSGPAGSGLASAVADANNSSIGTVEATYQSPFVSSPAIPPAGIWTVNYQGTTLDFDVPDPQAAARLVIPLPTVTVSGGGIQSVSWTYRSATTGANLGSAPAHLTGIQVQIEGIVGGRVYNSTELAPATTSHVLTSTVNWSNVQQMHMAYDDTLGNHYVVTFHKP